MSSPLPIFSRLPPCLCGLHHMNETALHHEGWGGIRGRVGHYHTVFLHQCTTSIIGLVIETNHSLSAAVAQATQIQISFRLGRKLKQGELTCDPFLIFLQQFGEPWRGYFIFQGGDANNLLEMYYITPRRMTKLPTAQSDENKPNRTPQFHGDTARCNEVTLWLPSSPREKKISAIGKRKKKQAM